MRTTAEATKISVITCTELKDTGRVSFSFMFDSQAPSENFLRFKNWGVLKVEPKGDDYFDPWAWADNQRAGLRHGDEGYKQCCGDDGISRFGYHLFDSKGFVLSAGIDDGDGDSKSTFETLIHDSPNAVVLMERAFFDAWKAACEAEGVEVIVHHFDGPLSTA